MQHTARKHEPLDAPVAGLSGRARAGPRPSKKERILDLYKMGMTNVAELALAVNSQPSYVGRVLTEAGLLSGYFDLYTTSARLMNFYSRFCRGIVRFKSPEEARASVERIDELYGEFESRGDRAGQHHAEVMALTGMNRALSCGKREEARVFADWLIERLQQDSGLTGVRSQESGVGERLAGQDSA